MTKQLKAWVRQSHRTKDAHPDKKRWEVIWTDPHRNYRQRTKGGFKTKKLAQGWADDFLTKARRHEYIDPEAQAITFGEFAEKWLRTKNKRLNTMRSYTIILTGKRSALHQRFGKTPLSAITHNGIAEWVADMTAQGKAAQTVRNHFFVMRAVLEYAVRCDLLLKNPALGVDLPAQRKAWHGMEDRYPLTPAEAEHIIANLADPTHAMFTRLVAATGLRPEEAVGLRLCDVDLDEGTVRVDGVVVEIDGELIREDKKAKNDHSRRTIDLDGSTLGHLKSYIAHHRKVAAKRFAQHPEHDHPGDSLPLFVGVGPDYSTPFRYAPFSKGEWHRAVAAAGLPRMRCYDLRHAHASLLVGLLGQPGALSLKEVQQRLGHHSAVMTLDRYAHAGKRDRDKRRSALDAAMGTGTDGNVTLITSKKRRTS